MLSQINIETIGSIAKLETLISVDNNVMPNTLVLESMEPFPGYHGNNLPTGSIPYSIFMITAKKNTFERIQRITHNIKRFLKFSFDASWGKICIHNDNYYCIRLRGLESYEVIPEIQSNYVDEGIKMMKKKKVSSQAIIQLKKSFYLREAEEGIYFDLEEPLMYYLKIPIQLKWNAFKSITGKVKQNIDYSGFDAAPGAIYLRDLIDVVRIYARDWEIDQLRNVREKYLSEIKKNYL